MQQAANLFHYGRQQLCDCPSSQIAFSFLGESCTIMRNARRKLGPLTIDMSNVDKHGQTANRSR